MRFAAARSFFDVVVLDPRLRGNDKAPVPVPYPAPAPGPPLAASWPDLIRLPSSDSQRCQGVNAWLRARHDGIGLPSASISPTRTRLKSGIRLLQTRSL